MASKTETGLVQVGDGVQITPEGLLSVLVATLGQNGIARRGGLYGCLRRCCVGRAEGGLYLRCWGSRA